MWLPQKYVTYFFLSRKKYSIFLLFCQSIRIRFQPVRIDIALGKAKGDRICLKIIALVLGAKMFFMLF